MPNSFSRIPIFLLLAAVCCSLPAVAYSDEAVNYFSQGNALVATKNYTQAIAAFDQAIVLEPTYYEALDRKADALNRAGDFSDALVASSQALEIRPQYAKGWINRGQILYNIGYYYEDTLKNPKKAETYYQEQLAAFEKAIALEPENAEAWFNKGYALAGMKRYDEAIAAFDKVQALDPAYPNLALSQKQATVLRDAALLVHVRYAVPIAAIAILIIVLAGYFLYIRKKAGETEGPQNRQQRRKNIRERE